MMGLMERLEQALAALPERCRLIFVMNKLEGKNTVPDSRGTENFGEYRRNQMALAYKKLRNELKDCLPFLAFLYSIA